MSSLATCTATSASSFQRKTSLVMVPFTSPSEMVETTRGCSTLGSRPYLRVPPTVREFSFGHGIFDFHKEPKPCGPGSETRTAGERLRARWSWRQSWPDSIGAVFLVRVTEPLTLSTKRNFLQTGFRCVCHGTKFLPVTGTRVFASVGLPVTRGSMQAATLRWRTRRR